MKLTNKSWPLKGFFLFLWNKVMFPKMVHLIFGTGGKITPEEGAITANFKMVSVRWKWHRNSIDGVWRRPNQVFLFDETLNNSGRHTEVQRLAKKYGIKIIYFKGASDLMEKVTKYAATS